eukprot:CAMPEP_0178444564 /NCGR_PEP_ID=MMETSP0689_2-20121128/39592_1 /TAXON_ID=160604 /ORGANISM="Amphidinium massartii, Strain CS-259" /LENGTH=43 /DNA_ID= /DNA_START= /DNA_END= /DNA_ORIENTATION=
MAEVSKRADPIHTKAQHLQIWHQLQNTDVVEIIPPEVEVLDEV